MRQLSRYLARVDGLEYDAAPYVGADHVDVELRSDHQAVGFASAGDGFTKTVPLSECESLAWVRTVCTWRGQPFIAIDQRGDEMYCEYAGHDYLVAEDLGLDRHARGVYRRWVQIDELHGLRADYTYIVQA